MKLKNKFLQKMEETEKTEEIKRRRVTGEHCVFKEQGHRFFVKKLEDGTVEFWAYFSEGNFYYFGEEEYFLGTWTDEEGFDAVEGFRTKIPWQIQRATERLRKYMLGKDYRLRGENWTQ